MYYWIAYDQSTGQIVSVAGQSNHLPVKENLGQWLHGSYSIVSCQSDLDLNRNYRISVENDVVTDIQASPDPDPEVLPIVETVDQKLDKLSARIDKLEGS